MQLKDKTIVITGGTKGLGRAMAEAFVKEGANVVVCARREEDLKDLPEGINGIKADVTKEEELKNLANATLEEFGQIDIWVNNAGLWMSHSFIEDFDMNKVRNMMDVNVIGTINGSRVAIRSMKEKGFGTIVNIISTAALSERPTLSTYCASKWAVNGFTKSIRAEDRESHISILSVFPGGIKTDIFGDNKPNDYDTYMEPSFVADKIVENLKKENPEEELIIKRS